MMESIIYLLYRPFRLYFSLHLSAFCWFRFLFLRFGFFFRFSIFDTYTNMIFHPIRFYVRTALFLLCVNTFFTKMTTVTITTTTVAAVANTHTHISEKLRLNGRGGGEIKRQKSFEQIVYYSVSFCVYLQL